ncbi:C-4 sterol methyl oxidase [Haplosporangium sp. Z 767]|nr:C-4 sterol methyl oxidase [Haplosporangium sp. Z 767]KAF9190023.1 C-4 sterol methyl oxidase [Haplosporangium sp. Z 11]
MYASNTTIPLSTTTSPFVAHLESYWTSLFENRNEALVTLAMLFISHEIIYFGRCVPYLIADQIPSLQKYKIQQKQIQNTAQNQWKVFRYVLMSHFLFELPMIVGFHPVAVYFGMAISAVPFPSLSQMIPQIILFFVFEDFFHYWAHRGLHYGPFYKHIHKIHHEWSAPFGLTAEYAHPVEVMILGTGTIAGPLLWCYFTGDLHLATTMIWMTLRLFQAVEAHSGYDFPWSTHNWLPFWSGSEHHDYHHMAFTNNFSTSFRWWDHIFGTNKKYIAYKERRARELKEKKAASKKTQ